MTAGIVDESIIDFKTRRLGQSASDSVLKMKEVYIIIHTYIHTYKCLYIPRSARSCPVLWVANLFSAMAFSWMYVSPGSEAR